MGGDHRWEGLGMVSGLEADWGIFAARLSGLVRALPRDLQPTHRIADLDGFGSFDRVALQRAIELLLPGAPSDLLATIETAGELFDWHTKLVANGGTPPGPIPDRQGLVSTQVRLRPVEQRDMEDLYRAAIDPKSSVRWRFRGTIPSPQAFRDSFHAGTLTQLAVTDSRSDQLVGLVSAYSANHEAGYAYVAFYRADFKGPGGGHMTEGLCLFVDHLFRSWPFRKLYFEVPEYNLGFLTDYGAEIAQEEGRMRGHAYFEGRYVDVAIIAAYREPFMKLADLWWHQILPTPNDEGIDT